MTHTTQAKWGSAGFNAAHGFDGCAPCFMPESDINAQITAFYQRHPIWLNVVSKAERNVCRNRESGYVFEQDKQGNYTVAVYDPLASVISYLRDEKYHAGHTANVDIVRIYSLLDAIDMCNAIANADTWRIVLKGGQRCE